MNKNDCSETIKIDVIPLPRIELIVPTPNFTISFKHTEVRTQLPDINLPFFQDTERFTKIDDSLLQVLGSSELEKKYKWLFKKIFFILSVVMISVVIGFYFGLTSNN